MLTHSIAGRPLTHVRFGLHLGALGLSLRGALAEASRMAVPGALVDATGELSPAALSQSGRRDVRNLLHSHNLELSALGCPLHRGLDEAEDHQPRLEHVRRVLALSFDLGPRLVVVRAGPPPDGPDSSRGRALRESLLDLGACAERLGVRLALETGRASGPAVATFLRQFNTGGLAVSLDPADLLAHDVSPYEAVGALRGSIAHACARDCRRASAGRAGETVPLGEGDVDWPRFFAALEGADYRGYLTVTPEVGGDRLAAAAAGLTFLRGLVQ